MRAALILALSLASAVSYAQSPMSNPMYFDTLINGPVGAWADFQMRATKEDPVRMRYALVDRTSSEAVLEVETPSPAGVAIMRIVFSPSDGRAVGAKMRQGTSKGEDVPPATLGAARLLRGDEPIDGVETLKTPAGSFQCKKYTHKTPQGPMTVWMSDKAFPSGLVRLTAPNGIEIMLLKTGTGATPRY